MNLMSLLEPQDGEATYLCEDDEVVDLTAENITEHLEEMPIPNKLLDKLKSITRNSYWECVIRVLIGTGVLAIFVGLAIWGPILVRMQAGIVSVIGAFVIYQPGFLMPPRKHANKFFDGKVKGFLGCVTYKYVNKSGVGVLIFEDSTLNMPNIYEYNGIDKGEVALVLVNDRGEIMAFGSDTLLK